MVVPCMVLFARKRLWAWSITSEPPRLAVPRFTNGRRERLVLMKWLSTTTTLLARVMNRPGAAEVVEGVGVEDEIGVFRNLRGYVGSVALYGDHHGTVGGIGIWQWLYLRDTADVGEVVAANDDVLHAGTLTVGCDSEDEAMEGLADEGVVFPAGRRRTPAGCRGRGCIGICYCG